MALAIAVAGFALSWSGALRAQVAGDFRQFTDKQGRSLEARVVSVAPDKKTMKILLRDGKEVDLEILLLSLDDQQYLRDWVSTQPAGTSYRLEVTVEKISAKPADRRRSEFYRMTTEHVAYRLRVTNLSRETLPAPVIEYHLLTDEGVRIYRDEVDGDWEYSSVGSRIDGKVPKSVTQTTTLPDLVYNRSHEIITTPVEVDQVIGDGNYLYGEDTLIGTIVQVRDGAGTVIGTWRSGDPAIGRYEWDEAVKIAASGEDSANGVLSNRVNRFPLEKGATLPAQVVDIIGRTITVKAEIVPDAISPDGVIASYGGPSGGWAVFVKGGRITFAARKGARPAKEISAPLPAGTTPVEISAVYSENSLEMVINDLPMVSGESPGLAEEAYTEPLSVGFESGEPVTADYSAPFPFEGTISDASVRTGARRTPAGQ